MPPKQLRHILHLQTLQNTIPPCHHLPVVVGIQVGRTSEIKQLLSTALLTAIHCAIQKNNVVDYSLSLLGCSAFSTHLSSREET